MPFECPIPIDDYDTVTLAHGGGGRLTHKLITGMLLPALDNPMLAPLHDGAIVEWSGDRVAFSTDSYVITPPFFPGGDIGTLAVHGTVNDLAMCGARPVCLSLAFILEEGFLLKDLWRILVSIRESCATLDLPIATGDTKVVERGHGDGIFINTSGIGRVLPGADIAPSRVVPGDRVIVSGSIAEHGIAILSIREGLEFETTLQSDTAALWPAVERLIETCGSDVHALRDATRGGVASVVNEIAESARVGIVLQDAAIPVKEAVRGGCEMLGFDPLYVANEGRFLAFVAPDRVDDALRVLSDAPHCDGAAVIGEVVAAHPGVVRLANAFGGSRVVDMVSGEQLPRIC